MGVCPMHKDHIAMGVCPMHKDHIAMGVCQNVFFETKKRPDPYKHNFSKPKKARSQKNIFSKPKEVSIPNFFSKNNTNAEM